MKISEMNNCVEEMRKCYKFNDDETEIHLESPLSKDDYVFICTKDENGTQIEMTRRIDEIGE